MVATLGIVNVNTVSAESSSYNNNDNSYTVTYDNSANKYKYDGTDQTLFNINNMNCPDSSGCTYVVSTTNNSSGPQNGWTDILKSGNYEGTATTPGTYYLYVDATYEIIFNGTQHVYRKYGPVTISKADAPSVSITAPGADGETSGTPYYIVGGETVLSL